MATPVHVLFVLDSSGSMSSCESDVRGGFNKYVETLREDTDTKYRLSAITFSTYPHILFTDLDLKDVPELTAANYRPGGNTALYDALGAGMEGLTAAIKTVKKPFGTRRAIVVVMTDGYENASCHFAKSQIVSMIKEREANKNWTFVYLGADQDAWAVSESLGFTRGNTISYAGTASGTTLYNLAVSTQTFSHTNQSSTGNYFTPTQP